MLGQILSVTKYIKNISSLMKKNTNLENKQFIDENSKKPTNSSKNEYETKLANWTTNQLINYKTKTYSLKKEEIYDAWSDFINDKK